MSNRHRNWPLTCATALIASVVSADPTALASHPIDTKLNQAPPARSPSPKAADWLTAAPMKLTRTSPASAGCVATRVREWLRVRCPLKTFALSLLGGSTEGLSFWIGPENQGQYGEVQFPLRPGDRRVVQFWGQEADEAGGAIPVPTIVLQEQWIDGDVPTITVL